MSLFDFRRALVSRQAVKWILWVQLALTVSALVLAASLMFGQTRGSAGSGATVVTGAVVSLSILGYGFLLLLSAVVGLLAVRRDSPIWYWRAGMSLLAPGVLATVSSLSTLWNDDDAAQDAVPDEIWQSTQDTVLVLTWSHGLVFAAVVLAAVSALLLSLVRRKAGEAGSSAYQA